MGRGLSDLQRYILTEAGKRSRVYYTDVLVGFFGWKPKLPLKRNKAGDRIGADWATFRSEVVPNEDDGNLSLPGNQYFSKREIGEEAYSSVMAALSRSMRRLEVRGLITVLVGCYSRWSAAAITDQGREWLSVNSLAILPKS